MKHYIYILVVSAVFVAYAVVFDTFPRSTVSELERRTLATFPDFTSEKLRDGSFTREVSSWFSDSEPYRDDLMALSMYIKGYMGLAKSDDDVTFHASADDIYTLRQLRDSRVAHHQAAVYGIDIRVLRQNRGRRD